MRAQSRSEENSLTRKIFEEEGPWERRERRRRQKSESREKLFDFLSSWLGGGWCKLARWPMPLERKKFCVGPIKGAYLDKKREKGDNQRIGKENATQNCGAVVYSIDEGQSTEGGTTIPKIQKVHYLQRNQQIEIVRLRVLKIGLRPTATPRKKDGRLKLGSEPI